MNPETEAAIRTAVIGGEFMFPDGNASAVRIRHLSEGLGECGLRVHVLSLWPQPALPELRSTTSFIQRRVSYENLNEWANLNPRGIALRNQTLGQKWRWFVRSYSKSGAAARRIASLASHEYCDVLIIYGRSVCRLWPLIRAARRYNKLVIWDMVEGYHNFSGMLGWLNPIYWDWRLASLLLPKRVDAATAICQPLRGQLERRGLSRILIVPHIDEFSMLPQVSCSQTTREFKLLYVGSLIARDNPEMMWQIMRRLIGQSLPVRLWIAGKYDQVGEGKNIQRHVQRETELSQRVQFLGMLSDDQLCKARRQVDGFLLLRRNSPAETESFPVRLIECLKAGKPVFVSNVGDISLYLTHQLHAILLNPDDPEQAAQAIVQVIESDDRGFHLGLAGQKQAAQSFNRTLHAQRIIEFANQLFRCKGARG